MYVTTAPIDRSPSFGREASSTRGTSGQPAEYRGHNVYLFVDIIKTLPNVMRLIRKPV